MAQFIAYNPDVEVNRQTVLSVVNSMEKGRDTRKQILFKNGIDLNSDESWFKQQDWLNAFKEISEGLGQMNLFLIGKAIIESADFPPINNLEEGLKSVNVAYHMNHRLNYKIMFDRVNKTFVSGIGSYHLTDFNSKNKTAIVVCDNPYPSKFDEGIITQIGQKFKPHDSFFFKVTLDETKESRSNGGNSCTFNIKW